MNAMAISDFLHHFHFLRPFWLCLIIPAVLMSFYLFQREKQRNTWQQYIAPELLLPLLRGEINAPRKTLALLVLLTWTLCALALAGPVWQKMPTPVEKHDSALVILLDLSPSMLASDIKPSRLIAARHKIMDLLQLRKEGTTALIAYSGDAHVVSPLTDDTKTIASLLNVLDPSIMPVYGSNIEDALTQALALFEHAGYTEGNILLVTDGITTEAEENAAKILSGKRFTLSIIGIGTETGAPIPDARSGFIKDQQGNVILPQLHAELLQSLARQVNGHYSALQLNDSDIQPLAEGSVLFGNGKIRKSEKEFDEWRDTGALLCLPILFLLLFAFRRGVIVSLMLTLILFHTPRVNAGNAPAAPDPATTTTAMPASSSSLWDRVWLNDNQRAMKAMKAKNYPAAAQQFNDKSWKAAAQYEQGEYDSALKQFSQDGSSEGLYNQGNALAKSGHLPEALKAYDAALKQTPKFDDATYNKKIVEDLLAQKKKQPQDQKNDQSTPSDSAQDKNQQQQKQEQSSGKDTKQNQEGKNSKDSAQNQQGQQKNADSSAQQDKQKLQDNQNPSSTSDEKNSSQQAQKQDQANQSEDNKQSADAAKDKQAGQKQPTQTDQKTSGKDEATTNNKLSPEQKQALDQWLRQVPDDPSGLLRNKFEYYYQQRLQEQREGKSGKPLNDEERW